MQSFFRITPFKLGLLLSFFTVFLLNKNLEIFDALELQLLDQRFKNRGPILPGPEVVIAVVDEKSQDALGRWPWPRAVLAQLVDKLNEYHAATIGFDMVFSEPEVTVSAKPKSAREDKTSTGDEKLAASIQAGGNVVLGYFFHDSMEDVEHLKADVIRQGLEDLAPYAYTTADIQPGANPRKLIRVAAVENNLPLFNEAATTAGFFNLLPDRDGIMRHYPLIIHAGNRYFAPLFLKILANYLQEDALTFMMNEFGVQDLRVGNLALPSDDHGQFLINYYGGPKIFPHIAISDILQNKVPPERLEGRIVIVGATGKGIFDLRATPFDHLYPGVEINATVIDNILHENYLRMPAWYLTATYASILLIGFIQAWILSRSKALTGLMVTVLLMLLNYLINQKLFNRGIWMNLVYPSLQIFLTYTSITVFNYLAESKQKQFINNAFGQYLSPAVVKRLIENPNMLNLGGEQKRLTAFFSDVAGFSGISEKLTPIQLVDLLNEYLTAMTEIVLKYEGTIDKYEGDAIIAFFGAPLDHPDHAARACYASLEMQSILINMRANWKMQGRPELNARIGLNTGLMVIGNMGSKFRMDYTIMGDSVNLASRLEGTNKVYGTYLMISEFTYEDVRDLFDVRELDMIRVVGKSQPVRIYELLAKKGETPVHLAEIVPLFQQGLENYRKQDWESALTCFEQILEHQPNDGPSLTYFERCLVFQTTPPPKDWDGVFAMTSK